MDSLTALTIFFVALFAGISYLIMNFFNRWTKDSRYRILFNTLIFIGSFLLIASVTLCIFIMNLSFER